MNTLIEQFINIKIDNLKYILIIQKICKKYINKLSILQNIEYNKIELSYKSINVFYNLNNRFENDENNKIRESIIGLIITKNKIIYDYNISNRWNNFINEINNYIIKLTNGFNYDEINLTHKGGRKFNYDIDLNLVYNKNIIKNFKIEFKYNISEITEAPQFVSPTNLSKFLTNNYEEYFYDNYIKDIFTYYKFDIPDKDIYLKEIKNNKPKCVKNIQEKYYNGCKTSSKFLDNEFDTNFYNYCKNKSNESIKNFIENTDLKYKLLEEYLLDTQKDKVYMLYKKNKFYLDYYNNDVYKIIECKKNIEYNRYECINKNGVLKILLRWKNGNGIAFPAFQISYYKNR